jgi:hypothetical protein
MYGVYQWINVNVTYLDGTPAIGVRVNITNAAGQLDNTTTTNSSGLTNYSWITHRNSTTQFEQHRINISNSTYMQGNLSNFSMSKTVYIVFGTVVTDSCTYGGSGQFNVLWSDNCVWTNQYINLLLNALNVSFSGGAGTLTMNNVTINSTKIMLQSCNGACKLKENKTKYG